MLKKLSTDLNHILKETRRYERAIESLQRLWHSAKDYYEHKNGKGDEFIPDDVFEDNLRYCLKECRKFVR